MNRQNSLKIIPTTIIVLIIAAIAVFTVANWAEVVKKFQGAANKDGFEKIERNTVPPTTTNTPTTTMDEPKKVDSILEDTKTTPHPTETAKTTSKFDEPLSPPVKDSTPIGLDEPPILKPKDNSKTKIAEDNLATNVLIDSPKTNFNPEKPAKITKKKYHHVKKHHKKYKHHRVVKASGLEKRVSYLEKKFGIKKTKQTSLANRVYRLEKIITKSKK